jgi:pescadillo protein
VSALKVRKQREENLINRPTDDAVAQRRADAVAARVKKVQGESGEVRAKRKLAEQKREEATHRKMAVQLARKKAAKYYHMVSAAQKKVATKEKILETKAKTLQRGTAVVSGDGSTFQSSKASKRKEAVQRGLKSEDAAVRRKAEIKQKLEKSSTDPYKKLPKWVR